jgi:hypothetical protein
MRGVPVSGAPVSGAPVSQVPMLQMPTLRVSTSRVLMGVPMWGAPVSQVPMLRVQMRGVPMSGVPEEHPWAPALRPSSPRWSRHARSNRVPTPPAPNDQDSGTTAHVGESSLRLQPS